MKIPHYFIHLCNFFRIAVIMYYCRGNSDNFLICLSSKVKTLIVKTMQSVYTTYEVWHFEFFSRRDTLSIHHPPDISDGYN